MTGAQDKTVQLGNFSVSLSVKDIAASREFYEKLGFHVVGGDQSQKWLVLQNDTATIGLFQGMFQGNMLTFNPGWDRHKQTLKSFDDVRVIQAALESKGVVMLSSADLRGTGPASIMFTDPDGNVILVDQHVPKPGE